MPAPISDAVIRPLLTQGFESKWTATTIQQKILEHTGQKVSISTIRRRQKDWGMTQEKNYTLETLAPAISQMFDAPLTQKRMLIDLKNNENVQISSRTLRRQLRGLGLPRRHDDVDQGNLTIPEAVEKVTQLQLRFGKRLGVKGMKKKLVEEFNVHLHRYVYLPSHSIPFIIPFIILISISSKISLRDLVKTIQREIDPRGVQERLCKRFVRRQYFTDGPNFVWACDGHDKLKPHGIAIYGFIDCWSRKILGLFAHVTNSDPRHVGLWFLSVVEEVGGIPQKLTTDRGTETLDVASLQVTLGQLFTDKDTRQREQLHRYVKSSRNHKIEQLWDKMGDGVTREMKEGIMNAIGEGIYDEDDDFQQ